MDIDVAKLAGLVKRELSETERDGKPAKRIVAARTYDTTAEDLWDALTNAERIPRWFLPIEGELKVGGRFQTKGNAGGTVLACEPRKHFSITWEMHGQPSWVDVSLVTEGKERTRLTLVHVAHVPPEFWSQYGPGAVGMGWDLSLMGLGLYLDTGTPNDAAVFEAWSVTAEGKDFSRRSSDDWGRASIAAGTPEADAKACAERTRAFYTGDPPVGVG